MNWYKLARAEIYPYYENEDDAEEIGVPPPYDIAEGIDTSFQESQIKPSKNKEYSHFALLDNGNVAGGVMSEWDRDDTNMTAEYSFDVAVRPQYRGNQKIGIDLIDKAIENYQIEKDMYEDMGYDTVMKLWVVNPKLVKFLKNHKNFKIESEYPNGSANMIYLEK